MFCHLRWGEQSWKSLVRILMTPTGTSTQCHTHSRANSCKCQWICFKSLKMNNGRDVLPSGWWCCFQEYKSDSSAPDLHLYPISTSYMQQPNVYRFINENQYLLLFLTFGKTSHIGLNVSLNDLVSESKLKYEKLINQTHEMHICIHFLPVVLVNQISIIKILIIQKGMGHKNLKESLCNFNQNTNKYHLTYGDDQIE